LGQKSILTLINSMPILFIGFFFHFGIPKSLFDNKNLLKKENCMMISSSFEVGL